MFDLFPSNREYVTQGPHALICVYSFNSLKIYHTMKAGTLYAA